MTAIEHLLRYTTFSEICVVFGVAISVYLFFTSESWRLRHIPTAGVCGWPGLSVLSTVQFFLYGDELLHEYHDRYKGKPFKVASFNEWVVILNDGVEDIKESMKFSTTIASAKAFLIKMFHPKHTVGEVTLDYPHTIALVRRLTHELANNISEINNEAGTVIKEVLSVDEEWREYDIEEITQKIAGRVTSSMVVGTELSKNVEFLGICMQFTKTMFETAMTLNIMFPPIFLPLSPYIIKGVKPSLEAIRGFIEPIVKRSPCWDENKSEGEKSPTPLDWMINLAKGNKLQYSIDGFARRVAHLAFASLAATSTAFRITLYNIAAHPEYIPILRDEVEKCLSEDGCSKAAFDKMRKMDSFMQESHRTTPATSIVSPRTMLKDYILRDGTYLPQGTVIAHCIDFMNMDDDVFQNAHQFDGLRFYNMSLSGQNISITRLNSLFVLFGIGRQACPGRFFATLEIKLLLAYMLLNFDIKLSPKPADAGLRTTIFDKAPARGFVLLRRRKEAK